MDIERFLSLLSDPTKTKEDLLRMRANALSKNAIEHLHLAEQVLDERFPGWRIVQSRRGGGSSPTEAMFKGETRHFSSQKDAYVWLMSRFIQHYPAPFEVISSETFFVAKGERAFYFHKSLDRLFDGDQDKISDPNKHHRFPNGWYGKLVLSEDQKLSLLFKYALAGGLKIGVDWDWNEYSKRHPSIDELLGHLQSPDK